MLLERLDERRVLLDVPVQEALDIAAELLRALRVPAPPELTGIGDIAARWGAEFRKEWRRLGQPCPERLLSSAVDLCVELAGLASESWLLHGDYHYGNILGRGDDAWVVIDPKPLKGDAAYEVVPGAEVRGSGGDLVGHRQDDVRGSVGVVLLVKLFLSPLVEPRSEASLAGGAQPSRAGNSVLLGR